MNYVVGDIHNDNKKFNKLLELINLSEQDTLYILGDVFDRADYAPDPVGVYFNILKLGARCQVLRGNHDTWLADYILDYYDRLEKKKKLLPYTYNSFELMSQRLTPVDMQNLAKYIMSWPLQIELNIAGITQLVEA